MTLLSALVGLTSCGGDRQRSSLSSEAPTQQAVLVPNPGGAALLVVGNVVLNPSDAALRSRLEKLGFSVVVKDDTAVVSDDAKGKEVVVLSESSASSELSTKFRSVEVPVVANEVADWDELAMTGSSWTVDIGDIQTQTQLDLRAGSVFWSGPDGPSTVTLSPTKFVWGKVGPNALIGACLTGDVQRCAVFGYDQGTSMAGGFIAPARRVGMFLGTDTPAFLNDAGWKLFDNAVRWATQRPVRFIVGALPLSPADAAIKTHLEQLGLAVRTRSSSASTPQDGNGVAAIIVSESSNSVEIDAKYAETTTPVMTMEPGILDELKMTGPTWMEDYGEVLSRSSLQILLGTDPLAAGLSGNPVITTGPEKQLWGKPSASARKVASIEGDPSRIAIFAYDAGASMVGKVAPGPRISFPAGRDAAASFAPSGWQLFDAAVNATLGNKAPTAYPRLNQACRIPRSESTFDAVFSYVNESGHSVEAPIGPLNGFSPEPLDRAQPQVLLPGAHAFVVANVSGSLVWNLAGQMAQVSAVSSACDIQTDDGGKLYLRTPTSQFMSIGLNTTQALDEAIVPTDNVSNITPGETAGGLAISNDGEATYSVPLPSPPGLHSPNLALQYGSRRGNGLIGVGWGLSGLSTIRRCPMGQPYNAEVSPIEYDEATDGTTPKYALCLDGRRLIAVPDPSFASIRNYRIENDPRTQITVTEFDTLGPKTILIRDGSGNRLTFGGTTDSLIEGPKVVFNNQFPFPEGSLNYDTSARIGWALSRSEDVRGNAFTVTYERTLDQPDFSIDQRPIDIDFEFRAGTPTRGIHLSYEARPDLVSGFARGLKLVQKKRLTKIEMMGPMPQAKGLVRSFKLAYVDSQSITKRSLLQSVTECDGVGICKKPVTFEYEPGSFTFDNRTTAVGAIPNVANTGTIVAGDYNGDGWDDVFYPTVAGGVVSWNVSLSNGSTLGAPIAVAGLPNSLVGGFTPPATKMDLDADGFDEVGVFDAQLGKYRFQKAITTSPSVFEQGALSHVLGDNNGDGLPDAIVETTPLLFTAKINKPDRPGFFVTNPNVVLTTDLTKSLFGDIDGDGVNEILFGPTFGGIDKLVAYRFGTNSMRTPALTSLKVFTNDPFRYFFLDANGDGISDALRYAPNGKFMLQIGAGVGHFLGQWTPSPFPVPDVTQLPGSKDQGVRFADVDLDGQQDMIVIIPNTLPPAGSESFWTKFAPDGASTSQRLTGIPGAITAFNGNRLSVTMDVDGDGLTDIAQVSGDGLLHVYRRQTRAPDVLRKVTSSLGAHAEVGYSNAADSNVHTPGVSGATDCKYPFRCIRSKMQLVAEVLLDAGSPHGLVVQSHKYSGLRSSPLHGLLGAATHTIVDQLSGAETTIEMDNTTALSLADGSTRIAFAGLPKRTVSKVRALAGSERKITTEQTTKYENVGAANFFVVPTNVCNRRFENTGWMMEPTVQDRLAERCGQFGFDQFGNRSVSFWRTGEGDTLTIIDTLENWTEPRVLGVLRSRKRIVTTPAVGDVPANFTQTNTSYVPDGAGASKEITVEPNGSDQVRLVTTIDRNGRGQVTSVVQKGNVTAPRPDGTAIPPVFQSRTITVTYDEQDGVFPRTSTNSKGHQQILAYHPGLAVLAASQDENGVVEQLQYDGFGRVRGVNVAGGESITLHFLPVDGFGFRVQRAVAGGATSESVYDLLGREVKANSQGSRGRTIQSEVVYDDLGRVQRVSVPRFEGEMSKSKQYTYDPSGRVIEEMDADGMKTTVSYVGRTITTTDPLLKTRSLALDEYGRVKEQTIGGVTTTATYGPWGRLSKVLQPGGHATRMFYDNLGRRIRLVDPDVGEKKFVYNAFGELVHTSAPDLSVESASFDELGRTTTLLNSDGVTSFTYDVALNGIGKLSEARSPTGVVTDYKYDDFGRPKAETTSVPGYDPLKTGSTFDNFGRLDEIQYPAIGTNQPTRVKYRYSASGGDLLDVINVGSNERIWQAEDRNALGQVAQELFGNGLRVIRSHQTETGLLTGLGAAFVGAPALAAPGAPSESTATPDGLGSGARIQNLVFVYDGNRKLQARVDQLVGIQETLGYDEQGRIETWNLNGPAGARSFKFGYDESGNLTGRTTLIGSEPNTAFIHAGRPAAGPHAITAIESTSDYQYNLMGEQTSGPQRTIVYSRLGLPAQITTSATEAITFKYDGLGTRVEKRLSSLSSTIYAAGGLYERRSDANGALHVFHVMGDGRSLAQIEVRESTNGAITTLPTEYIHSDQLDSVETVTSSSGSAPGTTSPGTVVGRLRFDLHGRPSSATKPWEPKPDGSPFPGNVRRGFTGHEHDLETGLINAKGRIYDPKTAHFLSADPFVQSPFFGASHNRYSYVFNDPANLVDPSGFFGWSDLINPLFKGGVDTSCSGTIACAGAQASAQENPVISDSAESGRRGIGVGGGGVLGVAVTIGIVAGVIEIGEATGGDGGDASDDNGSNKTTNSGPSGGPSKGVGPSGGNASPGQPWYLSWVPGSNGGNQAYQAFVNGDYLSGTLFFVAGLGDAALAVFTAGEGSAAARALESTMMGIERSLATKGAGSVAPRLLSAIPPRILNAANHIFGSNLAKHNLGGLLGAFNGDATAATYALENAAQALANRGVISGVFKNTVVNVAGFAVTVRGRVIDGVAYLSTAFIP